MVLLIFLPKVSDSSTGFTAQQKWNSKKILLTRRNVGMQMKTLKIVYTEVVADCEYLDIKFYRILSVIGKHNCYLKTDLVKFYYVHKELLLMWLWKQIDLFSLSMYSRVREINQSYLFVPYQYSTYTTQTAERSFYTSKSCFNL